MTKQEEIREGLAVRLHTQERSTLRVTYETSPYNCSWELLLETQREEYRNTAENVFMGYLHSKGVVFKVDRELPRCGHVGLSVAHGDDNPICPLLEAGFVFVGPLIKENQCKFVMLVS